MKDKRRTYIICSCAGILILILIDQFTKYLAQVYLRGAEDKVWIPRVFRLHYLENRGAAFGLFQDRQVFFMLGALLIFFIVLYFYAKIPHQKRYYLMRAYAVLIVAGALGNMMDRLRLDYVVDFFYFSLIDFPIFNVADCYVVIGCALFAFSLLFYYTEEELSCFSFSKKA